MKKILLSSMVALAAIVSVNGQALYKDGFTGGVTTAAPFVGNGAGYSCTRTNPTSEFMTITRTVGAGSEYTGNAYTLYDNPENSSAPTNAALATPIDMATGINDTIFVIARSAGSAALRVDIQDNGTPAPYTSDFNVTNTLTLTPTFALYKYLYQNPQQAYSGTCTPTVPCNVDNSNIVIILLSVNNGTTNLGTVDIDYIQIGGTSKAITVLAGGAGGAPGFLTSTQSANANIASSKLYPNPTSDNARVELELKSSSNVKVTLSDVMGKEVMVISEGTSSSLTKEFSVANLNKGIYTVNYFINGAAAKSELLMVK